jgi:hypothetical protein
MDCGNNAISDLAHLDFRDNIGTYRLDIDGSGHLTYQSNVLAYASSLSSYLPKAGGTMTGTLTANGGMGLTGGMGISPTGTTNGLYFSNNGSKGCTLWLDSSGRLWITQDATSGTPRLITTSPAQATQ